MGSPDETTAEGIPAGQPGGRVCPQPGCACGGSMRHATPTPPAPADDAVIRASGRNCEVCGKYMGVYRDDDGAAPDLCEACAEVPAHDEVREATERVVKAWTRMDKPGAEAELNAAVDALYEAWTDAAERAQRDAGAAERAVVEAARAAQTLIRHLSQGIAGLVHADDDAERLYFVPKIVAAYGEFNEVATKIDAALRGTKGGAS